MKGQGSKICGHMVRGARINKPIWRVARIRVMDFGVGVGCSEGRALSFGRGGWKRWKYQGG